MAATSIRRARDLEGYLFPNTYALRGQAGADATVAHMVEAFDERIRCRAARRRRPRRGLSVREVVTLASLVEKETAQATERPIVAAVYHNRLTQKMPLQCDPTVVYALMQAAEVDGQHPQARICKSNRRTTPTSIPACRRGRSRHPAARQSRPPFGPPACRYLYFVSKNDGTHVFAETLAEHNRNVHGCQILYFQEKRKQEAEP